VRAAPAGHLPPMRLVRQHFIKTLSEEPAMVN
jgi:hypothetical protein